MERASTLREDVVARYGKGHPAALACFEEDFGAGIARLRCPPARRRPARTTDLPGRLCLEDRRRVSAARTLFGERAVSKLAYAVSIRTSERRRRVPIRGLERRQLERLREQRREAHRQRLAPTVTTVPRPDATPSRVSSKVLT